MFVIKLPPNPYYYSNSIPAESKNAVEEKRKVSQLKFRFASSEIISYISSSTDTSWFQVQR